jgi:hypothetical protein
MRTVGVEEEFLLVDLRHYRLVSAEQLLGDLVEHVRPALEVNGDLAETSEQVDRTEYFAGGRAPSDSGRPSSAAAASTTPSTPSSPPPFLDQLDSPASAPPVRMAVRAARSGRLPGRSTVPVRT